MNLFRTLLAIFYITAIGCTNQNYRLTNDTNIKTLYIVFDKLKSNNYDKDKIYQEYFIHAPKGKPDRSDSSKMYYKDTLFQKFHEVLNKSINYDILPLQKAKEQLGDSIIENDYYYDNQKDLIYVLVTNNKENKITNIYYFLMDGGKVVSLYPHTQDKKLFWWE